MVNYLRRSWSSICCALILTGVPVAVFSAGEAGILEVHVLNRQTGDPIAEAAVCLGTAAKPDQFGARRTNDNGVVRFENLPPNSLLVTASKQGVQGIQQLLEPVSQNRVVVLKAASGGGGPECSAPAAAAASGAEARLVIDRVAVGNAANGKHDEVLVSVAVSGKANQVRVSEQHDFAGADWQALHGPLSFTPSPGKGEKQLYVQVRHHVQAQGAVIEVVSPVKRVTYRR